MKGGGKALLLVEPELKDAYPNLDALLKDWNIEAGKDVVVDVSGMGQLFGAGELTPLAARVPVPRDHQGLPASLTAFHTAPQRAGGHGARRGRHRPGPRRRPRPQSWAETDLALKGP